jgi:glutamate dehydrogenase/leucine dehydrogenase
MVAAYNTVSALARERGLSMRIVAYTVSLERIARAMIRRGL